MYTENGCLGNGMYPMEEDDVRVVMCREGSPIDKDAGQGHTHTRFHVKSDRQIGEPDCGKQERGGMWSRLSFGREGWRNQALRGGRTGVISACRDAFAGISSAYLS